MTRHGTGNAQRHRTIVESPPSRWRVLAFGATVLVLVAVGLAVGFGDFFGRPDAETASAAPVRMSMAGFEPAVINASAGQQLAIELWTTDAAPHLQGGVHTLISDELGIFEELSAESRRTVTLQMPDQPGDYDIYCDTCCGGKASPTMHGILRVEGEA
jgi:cytochrome c oxidase subunit 2